MWPPRTNNIKVIRRNDMQQTTNLDLELYEATDNANLLDGYNSSMRKLDARDGELSTLINGLSATVQLYDGRITTAQQAADSASATAGSAADDAADAKTDAESALSSATQALADLGGMEFDHITPTDVGVKYVVGAGCNNIEISALVIHEKSSERGLIIGHLSGRITQSYPQGTTAWPQISAVVLSDWGRQSGLAAAAGDTIAFIQDLDFRAGDNTAQFIFRPTGAIEITWTDTLGDTLPANTEFCGSFVFPLTRK